MDTLFSTHLVLVSFVYRVLLNNTYFVGDIPMNIPTKFGSK